MKKKLRYFKNFMTYILGISLMMAVVPVDIYAQNSVEENAINNLLDIVNKEMETLYGEVNYYSMYNNGGKKFNLNTYTTTKAKYKEYYVLAYGSPNNFNNTQNKYRYLGYNMEDQYVDNPDYDFDEGYGSLQLHEKSLIKNPWDNDSVKDTYFISEGAYDGKFFSVTAPDGTKITLEELIQEGINKQYGNNRTYEGRIMYTNNAKPPSGKWGDYVHIISLPTMNSRGHGFMYLKMKVGTPHYISVDIAAVNELSDSLEVEVKTDKAKVRNGDRVTATAYINSSFKDTVNANYRWKIIGKNTGKDYALEKGWPAKYEGYGDKGSGNEDIPKKGAAFSATIEMPKEPITFIFEIDAIKFKNKNIFIPSSGEAFVDWERFLRYEATYKLDYDELTKEIDHAVAANDTIDASVELPGKTNAAWISGDGGNLTGDPVAVDTSQLSQIFESSDVTNNPRVNEAGTSVVRSPHIEASLARSKFGDRPESSNYVNLSDPSQPIFKEVSVRLGGSSVTKPYTYTVEKERTKTKEDGSTYTETYTETESSTTSGKFVEGRDVIKTNVYAYNGKKNMPAVPARNFKKETTTSTGGAKPTTKISSSVLWVSDAYPMLVQRWMAHVDAIGGKIWEAVPGQYERIFTQQNKATITWDVGESMKSIYKEDRMSAANKVTNKSGYPHVPFATDRDLQGFDYPFKSGYYFNPAGEYVLTVRTEIFKDRPDSTVEHKDMVDALLANFRYGSNMDYKFETGKLKLQFNDSTKDQPKDTLLNAERDYNLVDTIELEHSPNSGGPTHLYFKEILEGYSESLTQGSKDNFKYREYIVDDQSIYKVIEETKVTIRVNEDNKMVHTHGGMKDGTYFMTAWTEPTDLSSITRAPNMIIKGSNQTIALDEIKITVKGSMYDDLNN